MRTVLVIDDDRLLSVALSLLATEGFEVGLSANGLPGLSMAVARRPDLILVDVSPSSEGERLARELRGNPVTGGTPIILVGTFEARALAKKGAAFGALATFSKPFESRDVVEFVVGVFDGRAEGRREAK